MFSICCFGCECEHKYIGVVSVDPDCVKTGIKKYECEYCDKTYEEVLSPYWHTPNNDGNCQRCDIKIATNLEFVLLQTCDGYSVIGGGKKYFEDTTLTIPSVYKEKSYYTERPVKEIGENAFTNLQFTYVNFPPSIKVLRNGAFSNCVKLKKTSFYKIEQINKNAFSGCVLLSKIYLPKTLNYIGENAFKNCFSLTNIYYEGNKSDWDLILIGEGNNNLLNANITFNYVGN